MLTIAMNEPADNLEMPLWLADKQIHEQAWINFKYYLYTFDISIFPIPNDLQKLLPADTLNDNGLPLRFCPSDSLAPAPYEQRIHTSGEISTRPGNWHDLCNALVWIRFPHIKTTMNALHVRGMAESDGPHRGVLRDALTLFDECGAIILSNSSGLLDAIAARDWHAAFVTHADEWGERTRVLMTGHATLEKCLSPYKGIASQCLLLKTELPLHRMPTNELLEATDRKLATEMRAGRILRNNGDLAPLPMMGIPGWWPESQDDQFYSDRKVFRQPRTGQDNAPVFPFQVRRDA